MESHCKNEGRRVAYSVSFTRNKLHCTMSESLALHDTTIKRFFTKPAHRFINRELSWLAFNTRVLQEACNPRVPLLERVKFLSISAANLDEFYMVRVAGLKDQIDRGTHALSDDGLTPKQQLEQIEQKAGELIAAQQDCWLQLKAALRKEGLHIVQHDALTDADKHWLRAYFEEHILPLLTPIAVDPAHPFPFVPNLGVVQVFQLVQPKRKSKKLIALLPFPLTQPRFIAITHGKVQRYVALEDAVMVCLEQLFPGYEATDSAVFRIVRDSDLEIEDEADDLMRNLNSAVKRRRYGRVVRMKTNIGTSQLLRDFMLDHLPAKKHDVIEVKDIVGLSQLGELYGLMGREDLRFPPFKVRYPERVNDFGGDCFAAISAKDFVVHHPFESFDVVVQFLEQAAADPQVVSIKQTLYRTSADSPIVRALIHAAEQGKAVTALVELKARFDEEANIRWARDMERAGVQVVYGFVDLKTHAKMTLVVRRQNDGTLKSFVHFGTGNYHPITAKVYTDLSFFTCDNALCSDANYLFNYITGYSKPTKFKKLFVAPAFMRKQVLALIAEEIAHAKAGRPAAIWAKMNSLIDPEVVDALYVASQAGVKIDLVVRGICALKPGIAGFSENIRVKSVVGRFLEHARIYAFGAGNGLPSPQAKLYISSADWMVRNFDHRVEVMVPIENPTVHAQILDQILVANMKDERQSWHLAPDGSYARFAMPEGAFAAHDYFMHNPSLSGRGKALQKIGGPEAVTATPTAPAKRVRKKR